MAFQDVYYSILIRRDSTENWQESNPILNLAELGLDTDILRLKAGNGIDKWNDLPYVNFLDNAQLYALLRLLTNMNESNIIFNVVKTEDDIYIKYKNPKNKDIVFVIDDDKFYIYDESIDQWRLLTVEDVGGDITRETIKVICNQLINDRLVSPITNSEEKIPTAGQIYRLNEVIQEHNRDQTSKTKELESYMKSIYNKDKIIDNLYISQTGSDNTGDGSLEKPFRTISKAIDSISIISNRNARTINLHILSNLTIATNEFIIPSIIGINRFIFSSENNCNLIIINNNDKCVEIDMSIAPVVFDNLTFTFKRNLYDIYLNLGSKVLFSNCTFVSTSVVTESVIATDKMCNLIIDNCKFNSNGCNSCVELNYSDGTIISSKLIGSNYGIILNSSLCVTENNTYNINVNYMKQIDSSQII